LTTPDELLRIGQLFTDRIINDLRDGSTQLDETHSEQQDWHSWRESIEFLAETLESLRRDGGLHSDVHREEMHRVLSSLAADPIRSSKAIEVLHLLQNY